MMSEHRVCYIMKDFGVGVAISVSCSFLYVNTSMMSKFEACCIKDVSVGTLQVGCASSVHGTLHWLRRPCPDSVQAGHQGHA